MLRDDDAPFLIDDRGAVTHREAARRVALLAERIERGACVQIEAVPSVECILSIIACWQSGALAVIVDGREPDAARIALDHNDEFAVALRTSGSSAAPKFAVHRLASLIANARASNARIEFASGDCWLLSLSPHHIGGLAIVVRAMVGGGAVRIGRGPAGIVDDVLAHRDITHCSLVATQLRRALDDDACAKRLARMKAVLLGGGPAPASWRHEAVRCGIPLRATYGLTECASQVATGIATERDDADAAGTPLDGVNLRIDDGEILVSGPTLFAGYLESGSIRDPRRSDGFFATGDLGALDARGHLHVHGRKDAMFISGGENIHPEEIENALREVRGITSACVVAIDDPKWQKRPVAFVVGPFDADELQRTLASRLPRFRWPDRVYEMPPDEAARVKPQRAALAAFAVRASERVLWTRM